MSIPFPDKCTHFENGNKYSSIYENFFLSNGLDSKENKNFPGLITGKRNDPTLRGVLDILET